MYHSPVIGVFLGLRSAKKEFAAFNRLTIKHLDVILFTQQHKCFFVE